MSKVYYRLSVIGTGVGEILSDDVEADTEAEALDVFANTLRQAGEQ